MIRREFIKGSLLPTLGFFSLPAWGGSVKNKPEKTHRSYWLEKLMQIALPVLEAAGTDRIKELMPVETPRNAYGNRDKVTHLEALGRTLAGVAPWLELTERREPERALYDKALKLSLNAIEHAVTPDAKSYMNFTDHGQPLVDAAFLAHALLRAPKQLWGNLDAPIRKKLVDALKSTRRIKPYYSNWLLFSAMIEAALLKFTGEYDPVRVDYAVKEHENWYKGDGIYGDGPELHCDYYNSYVIQPMLLDIVQTVSMETGDMKNLVDPIVRRAKRYAEIQERLISPEGTFPPLGRSIAYRCGAFQLLVQLALQKQLPQSLPPAQVRSALTSVINRTLDAPGTFDKNGWLTIGLSGHQPEIAEAYISTGSLYLCTVAFLPLGLPESDEFWRGEELEWTSKKAFSGKAFLIDKAI